VRPSGIGGDCFFATLECELLDRERFRTQAEAKMKVFNFIEGWYNLHRRHFALGYKSPMHFERTQLLAARGKLSA
jgi:putative transposase